ncbi:hypothetical protein OIU74_011194 [Salix koriyanagi]|uniref:Uncharacterized protein n=2 Tax=Salix TaxID=40685 RepID=A0A9Q0TEP9_9ROSI|nr:hypothetical protein OIU74_011194 [Salix koriyanagi]
MIVSSEVVPTYHCIFNLSLKKKKKTLRFSFKTKPENWNWSMGTLEEDKHEADEEYYSEKTYENCLWSILVSMAGGLLLLWWGYEHHPTNTQLWMVPFGLILFLTPLIAWVALVGSGTCTCEVEDDESKTNDLVV